MKRALLVLTLVLALGFPALSQEGPGQKLRRLAQNLPAVGSQVETVSLGIRQVVAPAAPAPDPTDFVFAVPPDLDRHQTDLPPFTGRFPGLHLNLPLQVIPGTVNYLFVSDQPEEARDDRKRTAAVEGGPDPGPGAEGVYARSPLPAAAPIRVLMDHTNGTTRPLIMWLIWVPETDAAVSVRKRGEYVDKDSVKAGGIAFTQLSKTRFEPRSQVAAGQPLALVRLPMQPKETAVVHLEFNSTGRGELFAALTELREDPPSLAALNQLPVLHSVVWKEEQERLGKFIDPSQQPTRFNRIKESFQHARGHFQFPERLARGVYRAPTWQEGPAPPVQVFSLFESIPGTDVTVSGGASTDNRGKYGARVGFELTLESLPPGCRELALVVINRSSPYGGRHWVSNGRQASEVVFAPGVGSGMLGNKKAATLWRGPVREGDTLKLWSEPMANGSVQLWYLVVPIP